MNESYPTLPGNTEVVRAKSVLVIAPHFDDEILGCGGLLLQLKHSGSAIRLLFLSDGGRLDDSGELSESYATRRREEAEAVVSTLNVAGVEYLDLKDGELEYCRSDITEAIRRSVLSFRPALVLVPSPLEGSSDHRAAFGALFDLLAPLRDAGNLFQIAENINVLLYDVNRPAFPNLLVDVSAELATIEELMVLYASQQERHDYAAAARGIRQFRALSLPPEVKGAEAYYRMPAREFSLHSYSSMVEKLGGRIEPKAEDQGPLISVVVRTFNRPVLLDQALASLTASQYRRLEVIVVNDGGPVPNLAEDFPFPLRCLNLEHNQGRAAAANAGIEAAQGDYVAFLDDDDLIYREHYSQLVAATRLGAKVVYSDAAVGVYELTEGSGWIEVERSLPYSRDFDPDILRLDNYIPFHTVLMDRKLLLEVGPLDPTLPFFEDWDLLIRLSERTAFEHLRSVSCEYRHFRGKGHHILGERGAQRGDFLEFKQQVIARHWEGSDPGVLARAVSRLREEAVLFAQSAGQSRLALETSLREQASLEGDFHRQRGEVEALRGDYEVLEEVSREREKALEVLHEQEKAQESKIEELYAEIERLDALILRMEGTKAWRLHLAMERFKK